MLEVLVASTILAILVLATGSLFITLQRANVTVANNTRIDSDGRRVLAQLRRELRQSGWENSPSVGGPVDQVTISAPTTINGVPGCSSISFRRRTGFDTGATAEVDDWTGTITYLPVPDGQMRGVASGSDNRLALQRTEDANKNSVVDPGETMIVARNLSFALFERRDDNTVRISLEFMQPDPNYSGGAPPPPIVLRQIELVRLLNTKED